uniref:Telomere length regulation protein TEL2 homolog n=1 Tax=Heterorhabditis bacteriophora TaxID=37862 RepID=A0A1I7WWA2_HETBA
MHGYTNLFLQLEKQCMMDESDTVSGKSDAEKQGSDRTPDEDGYGVRGQNFIFSRIMGLRQRLGIYQIRNEGPLFARMETIPQIASVAKSVIRINQFPLVYIYIYTKLSRLHIIYFHYSDIHKEQLCSDLQMRWHDVFNFLSLSNQDLLEVCCRVFAASLPCFNTVLHEIEHGLLGCVRNVCIRALQMHPCDLWTTCGLLGAFSTDVIESMVKDLRQWVANRKSPQTMLNFLRTVQFVTVHTQTKDIYKMLLDTFITTLWAKRLGKVGVSPALAKSSSSQNQISASIAEFAKHELDPCMVAEFIGQFRGDNELALQLRNYAIVLIQRASSSSDSSEINSLLQCAHQALRINQVQIDKQSSFSAFRDALYTVCPYNYSVILFIVARLEAWQTTDDDKIFVTGCISLMHIIALYQILNFLTERDRQNGLNKAEFKWYTNREKQMSLDKKEMGITELGGHCRNFYENGTVPSTCNSSGSSMVVDEERVNLYEREDMLVAAMPSQAVKQLPFHPFLYHARSDIEQHLVPIIETEIDIYNVLVGIFLCWQTLVRVVPWLRTSLAFPRSLLLSSAVGKKSAEVIAKGQDLSIGEASTIEALLMQTTSRNAVVTCISMCFRKLPLCDTKIRLLQMGKEVAERWLNAPNVDPVRRARGPVYSVHVNVFQPGLRASTGVDGGIFLLESEANTWKSLEIRD